MINRVEEGGWCRFSKTLEDRVFCFSIPYTHTHRVFSDIRVLRNGGIIRNISVKEFPHYIRCTGTYF